MIIDSVTLHPQDPSSNFTIKSVPRPYGVRFEDDPHETLKQALKSNDLVIVDQRIRDIYYLNTSNPNLITVAALEYNKSLQSATTLYDEFTRRNVTKSDRIVAIGGGIIQDLVAFAAATYKRGIPWIYLPTTLLSQADSCIGGKCALNYGDAKNQIALFSAPREVIINPTFLQTLSATDLDSGMGEVLKLHITGNALGEYQNSGLTQKIQRSLMIKKAVVEDDEFEFGIRKSMNYGHTIGHAIEALSDYAIPHGIAVATGIVVVNNLVPMDPTDRALIKTLAEPLISPYKAQLKALDLTPLLSLIQKDKKASSGVATLVVVPHLGTTEFKSMALDANLERLVKKAVEDL